jgi:hypothetical protein
MAVLKISAQQLSVAFQNELLVVCGSKPSSGINAVQ